LTMWNGLKTYFQFDSTSRRSEALQTVRVLAPIQKQAMQWTRGFPTKVY